MNARMISMWRVFPLPSMSCAAGQVELKTQQQVLLAQQNQFDHDKLVLGRTIGLPIGQEFSLSETLPYRSLDQIAPGDALHRALEARSDYLSAQMQVRAAETARDAARAQRYPTLGLDANYGDIGSSFANSHGTFAVTGSLKFNIFDSGKIRSDVDQADAAVHQRKNEMADLGGQIDFQIRTALLDLDSDGFRSSGRCARCSTAGQSNTHPSARSLRSGCGRQH